LLSKQPLVDSLCMTSSSAYINKFTDANYAHLPIA